MQEIVSGIVREPEEEIAQGGERRTLAGLVRTVHEADGLARRELELTIGEVTIAVEVKGGQPHHCSPCRIATRVAAAASVIRPSRQSGSKGARDGSANSS